ncbi:Insect pheromone-binding family, A10/OS-D [Popillia japonica]|uniref:Insect pheromone-binding family, A10/OS-D n=1 Tax=Popillia japonica TaxID=7064 RepID=A0AAW1LS12_POPJA
MEVTFLFSTLIVGLFYVSEAQNNQQGLFLWKYKVDVNTVISSRRLLVNYINCLLDKGPCTAEATELKKILPNAISTQCKDCSLVEKQAVGKIFAHLLQYHREQWNQLLDKYDPEGTFRKQYELDGDEDYDEDKEAN